MDLGSKSVGRCRRAMQFDPRAARFIDDHEHTVVNEIALWRRTGHHAVVG